MSNLQKNIEDIFYKYIKKYVHKNKDLSLLQKQIKNKDNLITRNNFIGHITASGLVFFQNKILLIFHNKLRKYIQPGGHCDENDDSILEVAQREVFEETGLRTKIYNEEFIIPIYIDTHKIPENKKKNEPEHYHYDFMFLLKPLNKNILLEKTEVSDFKWVDINYNFKDKGIKNAAIKLIG